MHVCYIIHITYSVLLYTVLCILRLLALLYQFPLYMHQNMRYFLIISSFTKVHISNYGKSLHMYMYTLSAKIRMGRFRKMKIKKFFVLSKVYYKLSVKPIVITIDSFKGYKLGYKFREWYKFRE